MYKLKRYSPEPTEFGTCMIEDKTGDYVKADDVDKLLARFADWILCKCHNDPEGIVKKFKEQVEQ